MRLPAPTWAARRHRLLGVVLLVGACTVQAQGCPAPSQEAALRLRGEVQALRQAGRWSDAAARARCLVTVAEVVFGPAHATTVTLRQDLADLLRRAGDAAGADAIDGASATRPAGGDGLTVDAALKQLIVEGKALYERGDFEGAGDRCIVARRIIEAQHVAESLLVSIVLNECGRVFEAFGQYDNAVQRYRESDAMARRVLGERNPQSAVALNNLGLLHWKLRRHEPAADALAASLAMTDADDADRAVTLNNLGLVEEALGRHGAARARYEEARALLSRRFGRDHPNLIPVVDNLAAQAWRSGQLGEAVRQQAEANRIAERNIVAVIGLGSERQKLAYMRTFASQTDASVSLGLLAPQDPQHARLAAESVVRRKGRVLSAMAASLERLRGRSGPEQAEVWAAYMRSRDPRRGADGASAIPDAAGAEQAEGLIARLAGSDVAAEDLAREAGLPEIARALPPGSALLEFIAYVPRAPAEGGPFSASPPRYAAFLLQPDGALMWVDLGPRERIDRLVSDLRAGLANPRATYVRGVARDLHVALFGGFETRLAGLRHLFVAPDAALNLVPMATLVDAEGRALLDRFSLSYLSSGRELLRSRAVAGARRPAVIVADPDFGPDADALRRCGPFAPLRATQHEAAAIRSELPGAQVLSRGAATESAVKALARPRLLHLATHGYFGPLPGCDALDAAPLAQRAAPLQPLWRSGLVLAGANQLASGHDDGVLTAAEVSALDLTGTELVVLSACDSGLGDVMAGEGVFGLRRAFELAGARRQVMSLWKVPDAETALLMTAFYKALARGQEPASALAAAQRTLRDGEPRTAAPFYWAAFIVSGDPRPLAP